MRLSVVLISTLLIGQLVSCEPWFRFGAVLSSVGKTDEMVEAYRGYELYFDYINSQNKGKGFFLQGKPNTDGYYFKYRFLSRDDESDIMRHRRLVHELIEEEKVHFLGGSHADYASDEMRIANDHAILNYHCCVEPNVYYDNNYPTTFGITASNEGYTKSMVRTLLLREIDAVSVVYQEDDIFTRTTCEAAISFLRESGSPMIRAESMLDRKFNQTTLTDDFYEEVVQNTRVHSVDGVLACVFPEEGKKLVDAFHDARHPLKAFFLTIGPTKQSWVDQFQPKFRANDLFSAAQWHPSMKYTDTTFGSTLQYTEHYLEKYDDEAPTYIAAGASAVGHTLTQAIQNAFRYCDITNTKGDVEALLYDPQSITCDDQTDTRGYDRILKALAGLDMETFFGRVKFNYFGRNVGLETVTTQVQEYQTLTKEKQRRIESVMPLSYATALTIFPAANPYKPKCSPGSYIGQDPLIFGQCMQCGRGEASHAPNAKHCDSCPIGEWNNRFGQSACSPCPAGTTTEGRGAKRITECRCKPGFFNSAGLPGVECAPCPEGAVCEGATAPPIPLEGYWVNATFRMHVYQCDPPSICPGGESEKCAEGYTGRYLPPPIPKTVVPIPYPSLFLRMCSECARDYFSVIQKCYRCLSPALIVLLSVGLLVGWYVINVIVSRSVSSLEMMLGWAQLANIIGDINLNWTKNVTTMFGVANLLDFDVDILEPSCLLSWGFRQNFIVQLCLPFIMSLMAATGYASSALAHFVMIKHKWIRLSARGKEIFTLFVKLPQDETEMEMKWDATIATFLASVDITYVTIAKYCFDVFKCEDIAGVSVLRVAPAVVCSDRSDYKILVALACFGIVFYVIGYPAYIMWKLFDLHYRCAFSNPVNLRRSGFIYEKYELDYYFTPAINTVRKLLFVLVLVYMNNPAFQVGSMAILINASLMIHVYTAPYVDTYLDVLYSFLLVALMGEAFGGLMFYSENLPDANRAILEWIIMTTLFLLTVVFLAIFVMEIVKKYHIRCIKKEHRNFVRTRFGPTFSFFGGLRRSGSHVHNRSLDGQRQGLQPNFELLDTFKPAFVFRSFRKRPAMIKDWDRLTTMLKDYVSDQSDTSYLSLDPIAKFWRKLVDRFPELVDFLAVADDDTRKKFNDFAVNLYRDFYLSNKVTALPLMDILNWRDYAPIAQWLAIAPPADREFFIGVIIEMFQANDKKEVAETIKTRVENGGADPFLHTRGRDKRLSRAKMRVLKSIDSGSHPLYHSASVKKRKSTTAFGLGISKLKMSQKKRGGGGGNFQEGRTRSMDMDPCSSHDNGNNAASELDEELKSATVSQKTVQSVVNINCDANPQECASPGDVQIPKRSVSEQSRCSGRSVQFADDGEIHETAT